MRVIIFTIYLVILAVVKADFGKGFEEKDPENGNIKAKDGKFSIYQKITYVQLVHLDMRYDVSY